jgi:hypothetical protein
MGRLAHRAALLAIVGLGLCVTAPAPAHAVQRVSAATFEKRVFANPDRTLGGLTVSGDVTLSPSRGFHAKGVTFEGSLRAGWPGFIPPTGVGTGTWRLENVRFHGPVDLRFNYLTSFDCRRCVFDGDATFSGMSVLNGFRATRTTFRGYADLGAADLQTVNLSDTHFEKTADFSGTSLERFVGRRMRSNDAVLITWEQFGDDWARDERAWALGATGLAGERAARVAEFKSELQFWNRNFDRIGQTRDAREANFQLISLKRSVDFKPFSADYWAARVLELGSRYGTRPLRPIGIAAVAILLFWVALSILGRFAEKETNNPVPGGWRVPLAFAFSVESFVPFLTLPGVRDRWKLTQARWLEPIEAVLGAIVFGIAAYSLTYLL